MEKEMHELKMGGETVATYYEPEDVPPCRACGVKPVLKGKPYQSTRLECPVCGIRTGMSTSDNVNYGKWIAVRGGGSE